MTENLSSLSWELSVLSRSVAYQNLSGAATHVGLSQPQLSRIVARLEEALGAPLLDRGSRRHSAWNALAHRVSEAYLRLATHLDAELEALVDSQQVHYLRMGALEGLSGVAASFAHQILLGRGARIVELDVYDLNELEEGFLKGELKLIFSLREPARRKFRYRRTLGYQSVNAIERPLNAEDGCFEILSSYEYGARSARRKAETGILVSNSLVVRRAWLDRYGGRGTLPGEVRASPTGKPNENGVFMIGSDSIPQKAWDLIAGLKVKLSQN